MRITAPQSDRGGIGNIAIKIATKKPDRLPEAMHAIESGRFFGKIGINI